MFSLLVQHLEFEGGINSFTVDGLEFDMERTNSVKGPFLMVDFSGKKASFEGELGARHVARKGWDWIVNPPNFPGEWKPPFLLTDLSEVQLHYGGSIEVEMENPGENWVPLTESDFKNPFLIVAEDSSFFGVMSNGRYDGSKLTGDIAAFGGSSSEEKKIVGRGICFYETPELVWGKIKAAS